MPSYLESAAARETLACAFFKARTWAWEQPYYDAVELILFEWALEENLGQVGRWLRGGYAFAPVVEYYLPKDTKSARKFAYRSFVDEVATVAATLAVAPRMQRVMDQGGRVSFGNRVDIRRDSDRLFIPWERAWEMLSTACRRAATHAPYFVRTDIRRFYPEIERARLERIVTSVLPDDPIREFFQRLVRQPCPLLGNRGLPAGPAVSGFIANLFLLPLDGKVKRQWGGAGRFRRYVDDIFYFTRTRRGAVRVYHSLKREVAAFGLRLHTGGKLEIGYSRDPLGRGAPNPDWEGAERLFDRVFGSIFHVSPELWKLFLDQPDRFLKWYSRGLRWLGIFVSTDWLAQRMLTISGKGRGSKWLRPHRAYRLRFPPMNFDEIERRGMKQWAEEFRRRNAHFVRDLDRLTGWIRRLTNETYSGLGDVRRQGKKALKGGVFALRSFAGRMAHLRCGRSQHVFNMLIDHPWILDPGICINAFLSIPNSYGRLLDLLRSDRQEIVRAKAAWALGELGDPRAVLELWNAGVHGRGEIARRSALEALLRIDRWDDVPVAWIYGEASSQPIAALRKYFYLMLGRIRPDGVLEYLSRRHAEDGDYYCGLAIRFAQQETESLYHVRSRPRRLEGPIAAVPKGHPAERR